MDIVNASAAICPYIQSPENQMTNLREAAPGDIDHIMDLERLCFNEYTRESAETYRERIGYFPQGFMILEAEGEFTGAVSSEIWPYRAEIAADDFALGHSVRGALALTGEELYISSIAVLPQCRGRGYGDILFRGLIGHVKEKFPQVTKGILLINEDWKGARQIYLRNGFSDRKILKGFFTEGGGVHRDGIVMRNDRI
jgi:ribosomal-protein-alanine N-acetyltransferase